MPVKAKRVRFTIKDTNNLEPCIDELEVFNTSGENIALATAADARKSGGDISVARHELRFVNDGRYGNSRSWMSARSARAGSMVEFKQRARDRSRRLGPRSRRANSRTGSPSTIKSKSATAQAHGTPWRTPMTGKSLTREKQKAREADLKASAKRRSARSQAPARKNGRIDAKNSKRLKCAQKVFAGTFRTPDDIHVLNRGDPEQPKEPVTARRAQCPR
jgi:hypothetical protein